jgi:hypothetical protein
MGLTLKKGPKWEEDSFNHINKTSARIKEPMPNNDEYLEGIMKKMKEIKPKGGIPKKEKESKRKQPTEKEVHDNVMAIMEADQALKLITDKFPNLIVSEFARMSEDKNMIFLMDEGMTKKYRNWYKKLNKKYEGAIGGGMTFSFTPTSLGTVVKVKYFNEELDLTDYNDW